VRTFPVFAAFIAVLAVLGAAAVLQRPVRAVDAQRQHVLVSAALVAFPLLAAGAALGAARSYRPGDRERGVWSSLGLAAALWAAGRALFWYAQASFGHPMPFPSAADLLTAGFFLFGLLAVYQQYGAVRDLVGPTHRVAMVAVALVTLLVGYLLFLEPVVAGGLRTTAQSVSVAFSLAGLLLIPLATAPALAFFGGLAGYVWLLISASLVCIAVAVMWFSNAVFFDVWFVGHRSNALQIAGFALLAVGALWHRQLMREA
jgi:hypothetical protein